MNNYIPQGKKLIVSADGGLTFYRVVAEYIDSYNKLTRRTIFICTSSSGDIKHIACDIITHTRFISEDDDSF